MAMDLKWILSVKDNASPVFGQVQQAGKQMVDGIAGPVDSLVAKFNMLPGAIGAIATVAGGMGFKAVIDETVNWNLSVAKLANTMGASLSDASAYSDALHQVGIEQEVAMSAGLKLAKTMNSDAEIFEQLGIRVKNSNGSYRDTISVMTEVNQKLANLPAGFDRNTVAMRLYGRSWGEIQQLLKATPQVVEDSRQKLKEMGLEVTESGVKTSKEYKMAMVDLLDAADDLKVKLGTELLPVFTEIATKLAEDGPKAVRLFGESLSWAKENATLLELGMAALVAPRIMTGLTSMVGVIGGVTAAWQAMTVAAMANPVGAALILGGGAVYFGAQAIAAPENNRVQAQLQESQKSLEASTGRLNNRLKELGFSSWQEFEKAEKTGKVVFDRLANTWKMAENSPEKKSHDKTQLDFMDKDLAAYKAKMDREQDLSKKQSDIQLSILKNQYDQGMVATDDYYNQSNQAALASAQKRVDIATSYLSKEQQVMAFVREKFGISSNEFVSQKAKEEAAIKSVQDAEMEYARTFIDQEAKRAEALRRVNAVYDEQATKMLETAGSYEEAEARRQAAYRLSDEYLRLQSDALAGNEHAWAAMMAVEQQEAAGLVTAQQKGTAALREHEQAIKSLTDETNKLLGVYVEETALEKLLREEKEKLEPLENRLAIAKANGSANAVARLNEEIAANKRLYDLKAAELGMEQSIAAFKQSQADAARVNSGEVVGWNGNTPILADEGDAFVNGVAIGASNGIGRYTPYQTSAKKAPQGQDDWGNMPGSPYYMGGSGYSTGVVFTDVTGNPISGYRASGGPVKPYRNYLVGEKGPEILRMGSQGGTVIPNDKLGGNITIGDVHINLPNVTDQKSSRDLAREIIPHMMNYLQNRVRPGTFG